MTYIFNIYSFFSCFWLLVLLKLSKNVKLIANCEGLFEIWKYNVKRNLFLIKKSSSTFF